jgi:di/tricarboxylate transporter
VAILSIISRYIFGVLSIKSIFAGFSNMMVVLIATLFIVGEAKNGTGIAAWIGHKIIILFNYNVNKLLISLVLGIFPS